MSITPHDTFRPQPREEDLVVTEVGDGLLIYDERTHEIHELNRGARTIWNECDGLRNIEDIERLCSTTLGHELPDGVVTDTIRQFVEVGLIESKESVPELGTTTSRRRFMKRAGVAGAIALPTVISVSAPTAAHHQSGQCHDFNEACSSHDDCCGALTCQGRFDSVCM